MSTKRNIVLTSGWAVVAENSLSVDPLMVTRDHVVKVLQRQPKALGY